LCPTGPLGMTSLPTTTPARTHAIPTAHSTLPNLMPTTCTSSELARSLAVTTVSSCFTATSSSHNSSKVPRAPTSPSQSSATVTLAPWTASSVSGLHMIHMLSTMPSTNHLARICLKRPSAEFALQLAELVLASSTVTFRPRTPTVVSLAPSYSRVCLATLRLAQ